MRGDPPPPSHLPPHAHIFTPMTTTPAPDIERISQQVSADSELTERIFTAAEPVIVGQRRMLEALLIGLLTRLLKPHAGEVRLDGKRVQEIGRLELAKHVAVVPQGGDLPEAFSVQEIVMMGRTPHLGFLASETQKDVGIAEAALRRTDTWQFRTRAAGSLSGGERQRVLLARALAQEPDFLFLDEPTNHLDLKYQVEVLRFVKREVARGLGALIVLHDLNLAARVCERVLVMRRGACVALGKPGDVLTKERLEEVYNADISVFAQPDTGATVILPEL